MVAIKDMETPRSCYECDLHNYHNCDLTNDDIEKYLDDGSKHPNCPLVEIGTCKDCKHWKDSDGVYRRGVGAESKCPINNSRVFEGTFYCADFEKRGNENE